MPGRPRSPRGRSRQPPAGRPSRTRTPPEARAAFEQLFRETRTDLLAYIVRRSESAEDAADVFAETYLIAWQKLDAIPPDERARLWLFGVARNRILKGATRRRSDH